MTGPQPARRLVPIWILVGLLLGALALVVRGPLGGRAERRAGEAGRGTEAQVEPRVEAARRASLEVAEDPVPPEEDTASRTVVEVGDAAGSTRDAVPAGADENRSWSGVVVDRLTGAPVADAELRLVSAPPASQAAEVVGRSGSDGRFTLARATAGPADLFLDHPDYVEQCVPRVDLEASGSFSLVRTGRIEGFVAADRALEAGSVGLVHQRTSSEKFWDVRFAALQPDGTFAFRDVAPGEYAVRARAEGFAPTTTAGLILGAGEVLKVELELARGATLIVRVSTSNGETVSDAWIEVTSAGRIARRGRMTSEVFEVGGLGAGSYSVCCTWNDGQEVVETVELEAGERRELGLRLPPVLRLRGTVLSADGEPVEGARVHSTPGTFQETDASGAFALDVPAQPLRVTARSGDQVAALEVSDPSRFVDARVELRFPPPLSLRGVVRDPAGGSLARAEVGVRRTELVLESVAVDGEGRFVIERIPGGPFTVEIQCAGFLGSSRSLDRPSLDPDSVLEFVLSPAHELTVVAVDAWGSGISDQPIRLTALDGDAPRPEKLGSRHGTDDSGRAEYALAPGAYDVSSSSYEWRLTGPDPVRVVVPDRDRVVLTLEPRGRLARASIVGVIESTAGGVPEGIRIQGFVGGTYSVVGGQLGATGLTPTRHSLRILADGHAPARIAKIDLEPGVETDLGLILLEPATELTVTVVDERGGAVEDATVRIVGRAESDGGRGVGAAGVGLPHVGSGRYASPHAPRGIWTLEVEHPDFERLRRRVEIRAAPEQTLQVVLGG